MDHQFLKLLSALFIGFGPALCAASPIQDAYQLEINAGACERAYLTGPVISLNHVLATNGMNIWERGSGRVRRAPSLPASSFDEIEQAEPTAEIHWSNSWWPNFMLVERLGNRKVAVLDVPAAPFQLFIKEKDFTHVHPELALAVNQLRSNASTNGFEYAIIAIRLRRDAKTQTVLSSPFTSQRRSEINSEQMIKSKNQFLNQIARRLEPGEAIELLDQTILHNHPSDGPLSDVDDEYVRSLFDLTQGHLTSRIIAVPMKKGLIYRRSLFPLPGAHVWLRRTR